MLNILYGECQIIPYLNLKSCNSPLNSHQATSKAKAVSLCNVRLYQQKMGLIVTDDDIIFGPTGFHPFARLFKSTQNSQ